MKAFDGDWGALYAQLNRARQRRQGARIEPEAVAFLTDLMTKDAWRTHPTREEER